MKVLLIKTMIILSVMSVVSQTWGKGQEKQPPAAPAVQKDSSSDKLDIKNLEKQYWSSKDTDFQVVQNRQYSKAKRFSASLMYGLLINDGYEEGNITSLTINYFFNEDFGLQASYLGSNLGYSNLTNSYREIEGGFPDHNRILSTVAFSAVYCPFYAKAALMNKSIIYFDMAIAAGLGNVTYEQLREDGNKQQTAPAFLFDITQSFFFHKYFAIRVDLRNQWYRQDKVKYRLPAGGSLGEESKQDTTLLLGITYYLP
jgi:outer membrane beta-barrel protein